MTPVLLVSTGRTGTGFFADLMTYQASFVRAVHGSRYPTFINVLSNFHLAEWLSAWGMALRWHRNRAPGES